MAHFTTRRSRKLSPLWFYGPSAAIGVVLLYLLVTSDGMAEIVRDPVPVAAVTAS